MSTSKIEKKRERSGNCLERHPKFATVCFQSSCIPVEINEKSNEMTTTCCDFLGFVSVQMDDQVDEGSHRDMS